MNDRSATDDNDEIDACLAKQENVKRTRQTCMLWLAMVEKTKKPIDVGVKKNFSI